MKSATMLLCAAAALMIAGCDDDDDDDGFDAGVADAGDFDADGLEDAGPTPDAGDAGQLADAAAGIRVPVAFCCAETTRAAGGMEGTPFELNCPIGNVVVGWTGYADTNRVWGLAIRCGGLNVTQLGDGTYEVVTGWATQSALAGGMTGNAVTSNCGDRQFARGMYGKADDELIYSLGFLCGQGSIGPDENVLVQGTSNSDFFGGSAGTGFTLQCPEDSVMTGLTGNANDELGLVRLVAVCAKASLTDDP